MSWLKCLFDVVTFLNVTGFTLNFKVLIQMQHLLANNEACTSKLTANYSNQRVEKVKFKAKRIRNIEEALMDFNLTIFAAIELILLPILDDKSRIFCWDFRSLQTILQKIHG